MSEIHRVGTSSTELRMSVMRRLSTTSTTTEHANYTGRRSRADGPDDVPWQSLTARTCDVKGDVALGSTVPVKADGARSMVTGPTTRRWNAGCPGR
jgi:hypothetical protein